MSQVNRALERLEEAGFTLIFAIRPDTAPGPDEWGRQNQPQMPELRLELDDLVKFPKHLLPIIFFDQKFLRQDDFQVQEYRNDNAQGLELQTINLCELEPKLKRFQRRLDEPAEVDFFAPYNGVMLICHLREAWYTEFLDLKRPATAQAREQLARDAQARQEEKAQQEQAALRPHEQRIRLLLDDTGFLKLARVKSTAQRTLLSYAKSREPEAAAALGELRLKEMLAELRDWLVLHSTK